MQCTKCGFENDANSAFCISCGTQMQPDQPGAAAQPEQPQPQPMPPQPLPLPDKNTLFGNVFYTKNSKFEFLFLAAFFMQFSFVPSSILLYLTKKPLPAFFSPLFSVVSLLLFVASAMVFFKKSTQTQAVKSKGVFVQTILSSTVCIVFLALVTLLFGLIYQQLVVFVPMLLQGDAKSILFLFVIVVLAILLTVVTLSAVVLFAAVFEYGLRFGILGRVYVSIWKRFLAGFHRVLLYSVVFGVLLYAANILSQWLLSLTDLLTLHGFIKIFVLYLFVALAYGYLFFLLANMSRKLLQRCEPDIRVQMSRAKKTPVPLFAVIVVALTAICLLLSVPVNPKTADSILTEVKIHMQRAESFGNLGLAQQSIFENDLAYSKLLALRGYLEGLSNFKKANPDLAARSQTDLKNAAAYSAKNRYLPYFSGKLALLGKNYAGAIDQFKIASYYAGEIPESYFGLLEAYTAQKDKPKADALFDVLAGKGIFYDTYADMQQFSTDKINDYIEKMIDLEAELGPKMIYKAIEKSKYLDYQTALNELMALQKTYPDDAGISYYIAKTADLMRAEQSNYGLVKTYAEAFDKQMDTTGDPVAEKEKKLFLAQMYINSANGAAAEQTLKALYGKYPEDADVAGRYAFVLNENKKPDDAIKVLDAAITRNPDDYNAVYLSAISYLNKKDVANSLARMQKLQVIVDRNPGLVPTLDKFVYTYSLEFSAIFTGDPVIAEVEKIKGNAVLYNYLYAVKGWKDKDSDKSNGYLVKVIAANKDLGYAYYAMGVNYFEKTVRTSSTDFSQAEKYYLKSLEILPSHVEGYFAIGHCYLKWGKNLEALRAFRKVVDLLPYEDHRTDPYGMTVHAQGMISQLNSFDVKEGE